MVRLFYDPAALSREQAAELCDLLDDASHGIKGVLQSRFGMSPKCAFPIEVFVTREPVISHVSEPETEPRVFLRGAYIQGRVVPYIHEMTHALSGCEHKSGWLTEGWANYIAELVPKQARAFSSPLFFNYGNRGVDGWVKTLLSREENKARLSQVFAADWPLESMKSDEGRRAFRTFAYVTTAAASITHAVVHRVSTLMADTSDRFVHQPRKRSFNGL